MEVLEIPIVSTHMHMSIMNSDKYPYGGAKLSRNPMQSITLNTPSAERLLDQVLKLGREVHLEMDENDLATLFLRALSDLFPGRALAIRTFDPRSTEEPRLYANSKVCTGLARERITLKPSSLEKTRLKSALVESARVQVGVRWESPFQGIVAGFIIPLVASGELYGVLDVGYPLGSDLSDEDETLILPIANYLSVTLRNERLHREMMMLRDYQSKLIEHANALILGVDKDWRITVCNQALSRLTGYTRVELVGRDIRTWLPKSELQRLSKLFLAALSGQYSDTVDVSLQTRSGTTVRTVWSIATIFSRGQIQDIVAIGQDQTKLLELQRQVIQAEKLATLGQLSAGVVHELNNPLTSITVYAAFLLKKARQAEENRAAMALNAGDVEKLERINSGAQRILSLSRDLVQYAKPHGDEFDLLSINQVVRQSLSFCEHLFDRACVKLEKRFGEGLADLLLIPGQMEQVVINLVTNAVQAVSTGGVVQVSTGARSQDHVEICIQDNGPGIPDKEKMCIFDPFYTTKTDGKGTGLGLSIVRNLVEQHSGTITVTDAPGGGACFTVVLPVTM